MTQKEIIEYNKKCAEFMGMIYDNHNDQPNKYWELTDKQNFISQKPYLQDKDLKFHSDWNWVIGIIARITLVAKENNHNKKYDEQWRLLFDYESYSFFSGNIESIIKAINQFLIWYEQNK